MQNDKLVYKVNIWVFFKNYFLKREGSFNICISANSALYGLHQVLT